MNQDFHDLVHDLNHLYKVVRRVERVLYKTIKSYEKKYGIQSKEVNYDVQHNENVREGG